VSRTLHRSVNSLACRCAFFACALVLCAAVASAQEAGSETQTPAPTGQITGRVIGEDGQPLPYAGVFARSLRRKFSNATSDADGRFTINNLERGVYDINGRLPGYYDASVLAPERGGRIYHQPGDALTIRMRKGGVITGRVSDAEGKPVIAVHVSAVRLRDAEGRPPNASLFFGSLAHSTDDRGVYRLYGLLPGTYIVFAGGRNRFGYDPRVIPSDDDVPTFYPSTTRDGASEIVLQSGQEVTDIDIRYRGDAGHAISGLVEGPSPLESPRAVLLYAAAGDYMQDALNLMGSGQSFVFGALPDGDYDVVAARLDREGVAVAAASQRITVRGADVTGVRLVPTPLATLAGRVVLEAAPADAAWRAQCQSKLDAVAAETVISLRREREQRAMYTQLAALQRPDIAPDDKGEFTLRGLAPGRFRLAVRLPGPDWYVRAAAFTSSTNSGVNMNTPAHSNTARTPTATAPPPAPARAATSTTNPLADGLTLAPGQQSGTLTFTLAPGAAALSGRVASAAEGTPLPELLVYLIPAERERADDALRYGVARTASDGTFTFIHLAPGRYQLLTRPAPPHEPGTDDADRVPFPDAATRGQLRHDAETTDTVELQPCQRRDDYVLRYAPR
jgi:protocatechuate 3,4-dioxygenase beta subunit